MLQPMSQNEIIIFSLIRYCLYMLFSVKTTYFFFLFQTKKIIRLKITHLNTYKYARMIFKSTYDQFIENFF